MSNLTSASGDASGSSGNKIETATNYPQQYLASQAQAQAVKKKRNQPGNPDPDAEVIALSPKTLLATNRFVCEICNKGFQREQNLQLHRRGHNLPWNLKQRTSREIRKKVYVCPEPTCVHHDPSRALGDLTGIKKHFCRKHGEKKWKCDKCSKKYAVQSDWKAHSKTCGTKEHRCDCGTLFSRRDSFVTHRAFCDAIAEERGRAITGAPNPILSSSNPHVNLQIPQFNAQDLHAISLKAEQQSFGTLRSELPPWLACPPTGPGAAAAGPGPGPGPDPGPPNQQQQAPIDLSSSSSSILSTTRFGQDFTHTHRDLGPNPNPSLGPTLQHYHSAAAPPHMSATALLQKAAQMGATISSKASSTITVASMRPHHQHQQQEQQHAHVSAAAAADDSSANYANTAGFCLNLSSREGLSSQGGGPLFVHGLAPLGNQAGPDTHNVVSSSGALLQDMVNSLSSAASGFERTPFDDAFSVGGVLNPKKDGGNNDGGGGNEGLTRDFLGLRPLSHSDILNLAVLGNCVNTSHDQQHSHQSQTTWQELKKEMLFDTLCGCNPCKWDSIPRRISVVYSHFNLCCMHSYLFCVISDPMVW